jgi:hypothetical protein
MDRRTFLGVLASDLLTAPLVAQAPRPEPGAVAPAQRREAPSALIRPVRLPLDRAAVPA